ncbi:class I SAM-dependent methyltransferase [Bradyrhizobium sp. TZ2]
MSGLFTFISPLMKQFRVSRARRIKRFFPDIDNRSIADVSGSLHFWSFVRSEIKPKQVVIYNIALDRQFNPDNVGREPDNIQATVYDGQHIPVNDKQIDILICNSVIEHVPPPDRAGLAREIKRVARNYVIQTPAKEFPVELHFLMPFLHWLPRPIGRVLAKISPFGLVERDAMVTRQLFDETNLLSAREFRRLFPEGHFVTERFLFLPKSYLIINKAAT